MSASNDLEKTTYTRLAILLIGVGVLLGLETFLRVPILRKLWPLLVALPGIGLIGIFFRRRSRGALYLVLGEYLICFSGMALYLNFTSWQNIAHIWPLFVLFLGIALLTLFVVNRKGKALLLVGLLLVSLAICFLFVFTLDARYWWSIFILVGLSILATVRVR